MTATQKSIYRDVRLRSRKTVLEATEALNTDANDKQANRVAKTQKKARANPRGKEKVYLENSANVLMDLRKAAAHPMLFRTQFTDNKLTTITRLLLKEPDFKKRGAVFDYVKEDMEVMTDAELQNFCKLYKVCRPWFSFVLAVECLFAVHAKISIRRRQLLGGRKDQGDAKAT